MALPRESRFAPLTINFLDCREAPPKRRHSFGGYIPYYLSEQGEKRVGPRCEKPDTNGASLESGSDACSTTLLPDSEDEWQHSASRGHHGAISRQSSLASALAEEEADTFWPATDDEWEGPLAPEHAMPVPVAQIAVRGPVMLPPATLPAIPDRMVPKVVQGLGNALSQAAANHDVLGSSTPLSCYHCPEKPSLSIGEYVLHLYRICGCSPNCCVYALVYISKAVETNSGKISVNCHTVHRLVLAALTVAAKYHDDHILSNASYAQAGLVEVDQLNMLESTFLEQLVWKLGAEDTIFKRLQQLLEISA